MKKTITILSFAALFFASCGDKKKEEAKEIESTPVEEVGAEETVSDVKSPDDYLALGEKLFAEKTCTTCHQVDTKVIGPSIKEISKVYAEKNANIVSFLKGESPAIVDTDPGQVAIMKANLDSFVKDMSSEELAALAVYIASIK